MAKCKLVDPLHVIWHDGERWVEVEWPEDGRYDIGYQLALPTRKEGVADYMGLYEGAVRRKVKDPLYATDSTMRTRNKRTLAHHIRSIADLLERGGYRNFPAYLRAAAKEMYLMNFEIASLKRRLLKLEKSARSSARGKQ